MSYISIKNYSKKLRGKYVLQNINLELEKGKVYGVEGHNGCGKTMLFTWGLVCVAHGKMIRIFGSN